jgi:hypothetical protein
MLDADLRAFRSPEQVRWGVRDAVHKRRAVMCSPCLALIDIDGDDRHPTVHSRDPGGSDFGFVVDLVCARKRANLMTSVDIDR